MVSDPLCLEIRLVDVGVGDDNILLALSWRKETCDGGSKKKKVAQLSINVRYMVIVILQVKIEYFIEGAHRNMERR